MTDYNLFKICVLGGTYFGKDAITAFQEAIVKGASIHTTLNFNNVKEPFALKIQDSLKCFHIESEEVSLLLVATLYCVSNVVEYLLDNGAKGLNDDEEQDMIFLCTELIDVPKLKLFTRKAQIIPHNNILTFSLLNNDIKMACILIYEGCSIKDQDLIYSLEFQRHKSVLIALIKRGNVNQKTYESKTTLMLACQKSSPAIVKELLKKGVDINAKDLRGQTALIYAVKTGSFQKVDLLLEYGANVYQALIAAEVYEKPSLYRIICKYFAAYKYAMRWRKLTLMKTLSNGRCHVLPTVILSGIVDQVLERGAPSQLSF
jgi:hypothetical protein